MITCILGTRAQLIKMAPLIRNMEERGWSLKLIHTGQHVQNIRETCTEFGIQSQWQSLYSGKEVNNIPMALKWLAYLIRQVICNAKKHLPASSHKKDIVLVHGDTFSTILGAVMGKMANMQVAHIESGLRSFNIWHPFPEELSRLLTFRIIDLAFCPGQWACDNLRDYRTITAINTGHNTLIDTLKLAQKINHQTNKAVHETPYVVCSIHRFENIYQTSTFIHIINLLTLISKTYPLIFVLHPATKNRLIKTGLMHTLQTTPGIELSERMGYADFIHLLSHSHFVVTDGGSNQEELAYLGIPTLLMRKTTERQEGLGANTVISDFSEHTVRNFMRSLEKYRIKADIPKVSPCAIILEQLAPFA